MADEPYEFIMLAKPRIREALQTLRQLGLDNRAAALIEDPEDTTNYRAQIRYGAFPASYYVRIWLSAANITALEAYDWFKLGNRQTF